MFSHDFSGTIEPYWLLAAKRFEVSNRDERCSTAPDTGDDVDQRNCDSNLQKDRDEGREREREWGIVRTTVCTACNEAIKRERERGREGERERERDG